MSGQRILCVGLCVLDVIHVCAEFPQEDTKKRCLDGYWQRGGNASNSSTVLAKLGAKCDLLTMLSSAPAFEFLVDDLQQRGIGTKSCPRTEMAPQFSTVLLVKDTRTIIYSGHDFPILKYVHFSKVNLSDYGWIHFEGRNVEETKQMIHRVRNYNKIQQQPITISVELEIKHDGLFTLAAEADVVFIGKDRAEHMGWTSAKETVYNCQETIKNLKAQNKEDLSPTPSIICPWGAVCSDTLDGRTNQHTCTKAIAVENVIDTLGAGDTFVGAAIHAMHNLKKNLPDAVNYANRVAAFKIQHRGYDCVAEFEM